MKARATPLDNPILDLIAARRIYTARVDTVRQLGDPLRGTDYDSTGGTGISDPTPNHAATLERWHSLHAEIEFTYIEVRTASARLWQLLNRVPSDIDTAAIAKRERCNTLLLTDRTGIDEWSNPDCENIYDRPTGHNAGLCGACIKRRNRWETNVHTSTA